MSKRNEPEGARTWILQLGLGLLASLPGIAGADVFTVTNANSSGAGSLSYALSQANARLGLDYIVFNIPGPGVKSIFTSDQLGLIDQVVIDGTSQPGYSGSPLVWVRGNSANPPPSVFVILSTGSGSGIQGLGITDFSANAITVWFDANGNWIQWNWLGFYPYGGPTGTTVIRNSDQFVNTRAIGVHGNSNVIRGNTISGVENGVFIGEGTPPGVKPTRLYVGNAIYWNYIGTNPGGTSAAGYGNTGDGVFLGGGARGTWIGPGNVISGNASAGVEMLHETNFGTIIFSNIIGLDATGTKVIGNGDCGVLLAGGANGNAIGGPWGANTIAGNALAGVALGQPTWGPANRNWVHNNVIGMNISATAGLGPQESGITISAGSYYNSIQGNQIGGFTYHGVSLWKSPVNSVSYNWIGRSAAGAVIPNGYFGIMCSDSGNGWMIGNVFGSNGWGSFGWYNCPRTAL